jgi:hypothetical protein
MASRHALPNGLRTPPVAKLCRYSLARAQSRFRRILSIPNPLHFFNLSECIVANWNAIQAMYSQSPICLSTPTRIPQNPRAVSPRFPRRDLALNQARQRGGRRSILQTDIADFYPSVYTHSIPWALHTKQVAKANRTNALFGNRIDQLVRNSQDGKAVGLPIGPDTSFVIAESILAAADLQFANLLPIDE